MQKDVRNYVRQCGVCQRGKPILQHPAGLLQPLPISEAIWVDISMDFIEGLPKSHGMDQVFRLHGMPKTIVSDRDKVFLSNFWQELFRLQQVDLMMSSAYHPQTDGQTEVVNRCLENYLRCMTSEHPKEWAKWISLAEWWYNSSFHSVAQCYGLIPLHGMGHESHIDQMGVDVGFI
ncbi:hypothetical protein RND81_03G212400 [Saponaria officinalis]|uniref:Integrase catalytic domain-containing protein n=1 Tax=Saponaria officinalis TaxID=3572 RepID=A0AAW1MAY3_SAPOF